MLVRLRLLFPRMKVFFLSRLRVSFFQSKYSLRSTLVYGLVVSSEGASRTLIICSLPHSPGTVLCQKRYTIPYLSADMLNEPCVILSLSLFSSQTTNFYMSITSPLWLNSTVNVTVVAQNIARIVPLSCMYLVYI